MATKAAAAKPLAEQIKPETLPVDLGGGDIQFVKRGDYAKRTAETFALKHKAEVKKDHVTQILDALDKGAEELPGEGNPDEFVKLFALVKEDYEAGQENVRETAAKAKAAEEEKARLEKEKAEKEEKLFKAIQDERPDLGDLSSQFDCGNMDRFIPKDGTTDEQLLAAFNTGLRMGEFTNWMMGDLLVELEKRGQTAVASRLCEQSGQPFSTVYNNCKTAKAFPPDKRVKGVSFTVYREVGNAKFTDEQREKSLPALVNEIAEGKHTTQSVREAVRKIQGKKEAEEVLPENDPKFVFLVIDPTLEDADQRIQKCVGIPKELLGGDAVIVNPKTMKKFVSYKAKPENRWVDLDTYESEEDKKKREDAEAEAAAKQAEADAKKADKKKNK